MSSGAVYSILSTSATPLPNIDEKRSQRPRVRLRVYRDLSAVSGELAHMEHDARLDVRSLVLVDDVRLCELVEHLLHFGEKFYGSCLVGRGAELAHGVTHRLSIVAIVQATSGGLTNSFHRGFVICHFELDFVCSEI